MFGMPGNFYQDTPALAQYTRELWERKRVGDSADERVGYSGGGTSDRGVSMRLLVCGSRDYGEGKKEGRFTEHALWQQQVLYMFLNGFRFAYPDLTIIQGECPYGGADRFAKLWAEAHSVAHEDYPADWDKYGKAAGPIRNKQMLVEGKPERAVGFLSTPLVNSRGTRNMLEQATKAKVQNTYIEVIEEDRALQLL